MDSKRRLSILIVQTHFSCPLFNIESEDDIPDIISNSAIEAAINFVETCCQHTAYICGHGGIAEGLSALGSGKNRRINSLKIRYIIATNAKQRTRKI